MQPALTALFRFALLIFSLPLLAQEARPYRSFTSQEYNKELRLADTIARLANRAIALNTPRFSSVETAEEITVPVVFHVVYVSDKDRVGEAQILAQLETLNEDFSAANVPKNDVRDPDGAFRKLAANTKIRFCRAAVDPTGLSVSGINFRRTVAAANANTVKEINGGFSPWDASRYLNIWILPLPKGNSGFAQSPGAKGLTDGIVIDPRYFGTGGAAVAPFDGGKTLTHLVGTYLGLGELWSREGCGDDGVEDTPVHNAPNFGTPGIGHVSTCDGYPREMTMNFMDNTDDAAQYMFTQGQAKRMRSVLAAGGLRSSLLETPIQCAKELSAIPFANNKNKVAGISNSSETLGIGSFEVTPNPAHDVARVSLVYPTRSTEANVSVYDASGKFVRAWTVANQGGGTATLELPAVDWPPGAYLIKVTYAGDHRFVKRLIVQ